MPTWLRILRLPFAFAFWLVIFLPFAFFVAILILTIAPDDWEDILDSARDIPRALWPEGP